MIMNLVQYWSRYQYCTTIFVVVIIIILDSRSLNQNNTFGCNEGLLDHTVAFSDDVNSPFDAI